MVQQYGEKRATEIINYSYENSTDPTKEVIPPPPPPPTTSLYHPPIPIAPQNISVYQQQLLQIQQYNESMRQMNSNQRIIPQNVNKFSPAYSRIMAVKPKATSSASIRLGGVYR